MILNDILSRRNDQDRFLFIKRVVTVAELCMITEIDDVVAMLTVGADIED